MNPAVIGHLGNVIFPDKGAALDPCVILVAHTAPPVPLFIAGFALLFVAAILSKTAGDVKFLRNAPVFEIVALRQLIATEAHGKREKGRRRVFCLNLGILEMGDSAGGCRFKPAGNDPIPGRYFFPPIPGFLVSSRLQTCFVE
jgi:hypothetical protein